MEIFRIAFDLFNDLVHGFTSTLNNQVVTATSESISVAWAAVDAANMVADVAVDAASSFVKTNSCASVDHTIIAANAAQKIAEAAIGAAQEVYMVALDVQTSHVMSTVDAVSLVVRAVNDATMQLASKTGESPDYSIVATNAASKVLQAVTDATSGTWHYPD